MTHTNEKSRRQSLRRRLLAERLAFAENPAFEAARDSLANRLLTVLTTLEPKSIGLYWPLRGEFNAIDAIRRAPISNTMRLALPHVRKLPPHMEYRAWDGIPPTDTDEAGIPSPQGEVLVPEVVLAPCLGFTDAPFRLGYGGGYFDRWLAANSHVVAVGVAWASARLLVGEFQPEPHDIALTLVVTQHEVI